MSIKLFWTIYKLSIRSMYFIDFVNITSAIIVYYTKTQSIKVIKFYQIPNYQLCIRTDVCHLIIKSNCLHITLCLRKVKIQRGLENLHFVASFIENLKVLSQACPIRGLRAGSGSRKYSNQPVTIL